MKYKELNEKLNQLKIEEFVWLIYICIIVLSLIANNKERKYFINNDLKSKEQYRSLMILIFVILIFVYLYFLKDSFDNFKKLKPTDSMKKKNLTYLSFLGSLAIVISGFIFLYIAIVDESLDVEIAFN